MGINTAQDLIEAGPERIRKQFSIVLGRTQHELNNVSCIEPDGAGIPKQQIMVSRLFGTSVTALADLAESATRAAEKLRLDGSVAASVCISLHTNHFRENEPQYQRSLFVPLSQPSDDTTKLIGAALPTNVLVWPMWKPVPAHAHWKISAVAVNMSVFWNASRKIATVMNPDRQLLDWAGSDFNPEQFDCHATNAALLRMAWNKWGGK